MSRLERIGKSILVLIAAFVSAVAVISAVVLVALAVFAQTGSQAVAYWQAAPTKLPTVTIGQHSNMYDKNGAKFAEVWTQDRRMMASTDESGRRIIDAIVSAEDKSFYTEGAFNPLATVRSFLTGSGGGSGITQQLMKNLVYYDTSASDNEKANATDQTIARKVRELKLAMQYSKTHGKDDIILEYMNTVAVGAPSTYGVQTAAQTIFGKNAKDLDVSEAAALAGSINNPSQFNLLLLDDPENSGRVQQRKEYVLDRMLADGKITQKEHDDAVAEKLNVNPTVSSGTCGSSAYPFYCQYVLNTLADDTLLGSTADERAATIAAGGLDIYTAMDPDIMNKATSQLMADYGSTNDAVQSTAFVDHGNGHVLAIAQNRDWGTDESAGQTQLVMPEQGSQTGSTYKMITLATAVNEGFSEQYLMSGISSACPWTKPGFDYPAGGVQNSTSCAWQGGRLTYKQATAFSSNTWFSELISQVGVLKVKEMSGKLGLSTPDDINERSVSLTLGTTSNSPIAMAAAYATFANEGVYCPATPLTSVKHVDGSAIEPPDDYDPSVYSCRSVMSQRAASTVLRAEKANVDGSIPNAFGTKAAIGGRTVVGKSGTTNDVANSAWTATVGQFTVFSNAYDPRGNFAYPLTNMLWRGYRVNAQLTDSVLLTTRDMMVNVLGNQPDSLLDLNNGSDSMAKANSQTADFVFVPDVRGMSPDAAVKTLDSLGFKGKVLKRSTKETASSDTATSPNGIVEKQSVEPGTKILKGKTRTVVLTVGK